MGLREKGKLEKQKRIQSAARSEFMQKGFEAATTRDIAHQAKISIGTLFVYAKDKRELLMMVINDDLEKVGVLAAQAIDTQNSLINQIILFFEPRFHYWAAHPKLGRPIVTEIFDVIGTADSLGPETKRFYERRSQILQSLIQIIEKAQQCNKAAADIQPALAASLVMTIYLTAVRRWLNQERPDAQEGIEQLRELLELAIRGIGP